MKNGLIVSETGNKSWYKNDRLHRENGPAFETQYGDKHWYYNGKQHRKDGPAIEFSTGASFWLINNKRHRLDGPAIECGNSKKWFFNDVEYSEEEHPFNVFRKEHNLSENYNDWAVDLKVLFKLIYGGDI
jgi:hypothetical protein